MALSEAAKELMFVIQLLGSMKIVIEYPVTIREDNKGAIFMASNITPHAMPSMWISGTSILMSMLRTEFLR